LGPFAGGYYLPLGLFKGMLPTDAKEKEREKKDEDE
jgi:hypothetical protein